MKEQDLQSAVLTQYRQGQSKRAIARSLRINVKTVRTIIRNGCVREIKPRSDRVGVDDALLVKLYADCDGYLERVYEILTEEHGISIGYSTLTRLARSKGLGDKPDSRSSHVPDRPGEEMQHDTTMYTLPIGGIKRKVICSGIYLRYSKMRYLRFYFRFNRFVMKCFIDEALRFWGHAAGQCIIDNTNLAILYGSGPGAVMHPEMMAFAKNYGFVWIAHAIGHANRKAGKERNFHTVETNFLPGRTFSSLGDLNEQALQWATVRYAKRPQSGTKLIPAELFEHEKPFLVKLPPFISSPYLPIKRRVDAYGYVVVDVNYYWVPQSVHERTVTVLRYADHLCIMNGCMELVRYKLPSDGVKNERFIPEGVEKQPRGVPKDRKQGCEQEEKHLRETGPIVNEYLDFVKLPGTPIKHKPAFIRRLYVLSKQVGQPLFLQTIQRALDYRVCNPDSVQRTAQLLLKTAFFPPPLTDAESPSDYQQRQAYQTGRFSEENPIDYDESTL
jgi:transposase